MWNVIRRLSISCFFEWYHGENFVPGILSPFCPSIQKILSGKRKLSRYRFASCPLFRNQRGLLYQLTAESLARSGKAEHQQILKVSDVQHVLTGVCVDKFTVIFIGPFIFILSLAEWELTESFHWKFMHFLSYNYPVNAWGTVCIEAESAMCLVASSSSGRWAYRSNSLVSMAKTGSFEMSKNFQQRLVLHAVYTPDRLGLWGMMRGIP